MGEVGHLLSDSPLEKRTKKNLESGSGPAKERLDDEKMSFEASKEDEEEEDRLRWLLIWGGRGAGREEVGHFRATMTNKLINSHPKVSHATRFLRFQTNPRVVVILEFRRRKRRYPKIEVMADPFCDSSLSPVSSFSRMGDGACARAPAEEDG